ncbi:uncharacterized protein LOC126909074 isoform X1 [Daktulosphaira vitifoliae]|uniref:uncharacterized protein LOC126909074 isoform X1 n=1 Tax=Daktulosphaira vitifoliae TaxID=58002 RepID=UPI0021AA4F59|nr:uncharacterized protein LOC126909074 isoform X1 [Daktulosphaira vitifoliae]
MNCVIYFGVILCVKSSFVISSTDRCFELIDEILRNPHSPIQPKRLTQEERLDKANEIALTFGNQSVEPIDEYVKFEVSEELEKILKKLPENYFSNKVRIGEFIKKLLETDDNNVPKIIDKLTYFDKEEYIDARICRQIINNQYYPIPSHFVNKFNMLAYIFKKFDQNKTGRIAIKDFEYVIKKVLVNDIVQTKILKSLSGVKDVCYEAWLLKKRKDVYESQYGLKGLYMKFITSIA